MGRNISFLNEEGYQYLVYQIDSDARRNSLSIGMQENNQIRQLVEAYFTDVGEGIKGEYSISDCLSFVDYFSEHPGRDEVFPFLQKILFSYKALSMRFLTESDVLLKKEYVYIDRESLTVRFIGAPEILNEDNTLQGLFTDILEQTSWDEHEETTYVNALQSVLNQKPGIDELLDAIKVVMAEPVTYKTIAEEKTIGDAGLTYGELKSPVPPAPVYEEPHPPAPATPAFATDPFGAAFGETTVLGIGSQPMVFPILIRIKTKEKIIINKNNFLIGKDARQVDYCVFDNSAVSRVHARIISRNGEFFIADIHSTNHVFVNGMMIDPASEVRLSHGSRVRLGDEDFEFRFQ